MNKKTTIGLIQIKVSENQKKNLANSINKIRSAAKKKSKNNMFT